MSSSDNLATTFPNVKPAMSSHRNGPLVTVATLASSINFTAKETPIIKLTKVEEWDLVKVSNYDEEQKHGQADEQICSVRSA